MKKAAILLSCAGLAMIIAAASVGYRPARAGETGSSGAPAEEFPATEATGQVVSDRRIDVRVLVNGLPLDAYYASGKNYVEAIEGAEYEVQIRNPFSTRVAVALSVDGLNTIDARRTTAWNASKWVIEPYGVINISGWQMSSRRARHFYFTSERDSYGAKLGQTANLGVVSAVFYCERHPIVVPVAPPPGPRPDYEEDGRRNTRSGEAAPATGSRTETSAKQKQNRATQFPDDEYAATGIGRSVANDVQWISLDLEPRPAAEVMIRYEYYPTLVRLGVLPRNYGRPEPLRRREGATGFEDRRYSPEP